MSTRTDHVLRWIAVLPAALGAYACAGFIALQSQRLFNDSLELGQFAASVAAPFAYLYVGTKTAPSYRMTTAIALTVLHAMGLAAIFSFIGYAMVVDNFSPTKLTFAWDIIRAAISLAVSIWVCVDISRNEGNHASSYGVEQPADVYLSATKETKQHEPFGRN